MARYEFRFVVTDTELSEDQQDRVGQAIAEAGALAVAGLTPRDAVTVRIGANRYWRGFPPVPVFQALEEAAARKAEEESAGDAG